MARQAKVLLNCTGPYRFLGEAVRFQLVAGRAGVQGDDVAGAMWCAGG
jgi:short subunit dehydrogenase-like uncharacterized protein